MNTQRTLGIVLSAPLVVASFGKLRRFVKPCGSKGHQEACRGRRSGSRSRLETSRDSDSRKLAADSRCKGPRGSAGVGGAARLGPNRPGRRAWERRKSGRSSRVAAVWARR